MKPQPLQLGLHGSGWKELGQLGLPEAGGVQPRPLLSSLPGVPASEEAEFSGGKVLPSSAPTFSGPGGLELWGPRFAEAPPLRRVPDPSFRGQLQRVTPAWEPGVHAALGTSPPPGA